MYKQLILFIIFLMASSFSFAEGTFFVGKSGQFNNIDSSYSDDSTDSLTIITLSGVNLGDYTRYKDTIGMHVGFGFGESTFEKRRTNYISNKMFTVGLNFPFYNTFYVNFGGNGLWSTLKSNDDSIEKAAESENEYIISWHAGVGTLIYDSVAIEAGYNANIDTWTASIGWQWR